MKFASPGKRDARVALVIIYLFCFAVISLLTIFSISQHEVPKRSNNEDSTFDTHLFNHDHLSLQNNRAGCNTIHLAVVCGGFNSTRNFYVLLKSILFYRVDKIKIHLFVDGISRVILKELFNSWRVQDLDVKYYNLTEYEPEISWIMNQHYSRRYGLLKLAVLSALADDELEKVIVIDTDMLVLGDIKQAWNKFENMTTDNHEKPVFGLVENQSNWYLGDTRLSGGKSVWPAIGRGYNSGIMLVNLVELRKHDWRQVWRQVAESELTVHLSTTLADQDILNAVLRLYPYMLFKLPCSYNVQLNDHTNIDDTCPSLRNDFQIIHWNSPYKFSTKNPHAQYYTNKYLTFRNWDGHLLERGYCRQEVTSVKEPLSKSWSSLDTICRAIQPRPEDTLRTFLYFLDYELETTAFDATLVVHFSLDRLQVLDEIAVNWAGPISAAIYLSELETNLFIMSIENSENLSQRRNIGYHLVFKDFGFNYPINKLRNIALDNVMTEYVFLSDIDFLPSPNLYNYLKQTLSDWSKNGNGTNILERQVLVVPAFENLQYKFDFPLSKVELLTQLDLGSVSVFRDHLWPRGHEPTNYAKWRVATKPYKVDWKPEYEPFIVTTRNVIRFDERFVGFGWNKVEHVMQLAALGYEFTVLPEAFIIHKLHSASYDIMRHRQSFTYRSCIKQLKKAFLLELRAKFPDFFAKISASAAVTAAAMNQPA